MTHEREEAQEASGGPEHDHTLPDADKVPVSDGPFDLEPHIRPDEWDNEGDDE